MSSNARDVKSQVPASGADLKKSDNIQPVGRFGYPYQAWLVGQMSNEITRALEEYINGTKQQDEVKAKDSWDAIRFKVGNNVQIGTSIEVARYQIASSICSKFYELWRTTRTQLASDEKNGIRNKSTVHEFFKKAWTLLQEGHHVMAKVESRYGKQKGSEALFKLLGQSAKMCDEVYRWLIHVMQPRIYQLRIPEADFKELNGNRFCVEGKGMAAGKSVGGALQLAGCVAGMAAEIVFVPALAADLFLTEGVGLRALTLGAASGAKTLGEGVSRYGFAMKQDIPPEWVVGEVVVKPPSGGVARSVTPVGRQQVQAIADSKQKFVTVYTVDGASPEDFLKKGTNYHLGVEGFHNSHGHAIYFANPLDAYWCSIARADGSQYDPIGGWRRNNVWSEQERILLQSALKQSEAKQANVVIPQSVTASPQAAKDPSAAVPAAKEAPVVVSSSNAPPAAAASAPAAEINWDEAPTTRARSGATHSEPKLGGAGPSGRKH